MNMKNGQKANKAVKVNNSLRQTGHHANKTSISSKEATGHPFTTFVHARAPVCPFRMV